MIFEDHVLAKSRDQVAGRWGLGLAGFRTKCGMTEKTMQNNGKSMPNDSPATLKQQN